MKVTNIAVEVDGRLSVVSEGERFEAEAGGLRLSVRTDEERLEHLHFVLVSAEVFDENVIDRIRRVLTEI